MLMVDDNVAVTGEPMTDEEILQEIQEIDTVEEKENDSVDEMVAKPTPEETRNAIETLVNFSMFTESGEIGDIAVKASTLVEKELYRS